MSEFSPSSDDREIDRIELDLAPLLEGYEDREEAAWDYVQLTKRINAELSKRAIYITLYNGREPVGGEANNQSMRRVFDEELINDAILEAAKERRHISDAAARVIASQLHSGQDSALYTLASSGGIGEHLLMEVQGAAQDPMLDPLARAWAKELEEYANARIQRDEWAAVKGWSRLWLGGGS